MTPISDSISLDINNDIAVLTIDDGRVNALSYDLLSAGRDAFAKAATEASAIVIAGRSGALSAGFDLNEVVRGPEFRDAIIEAGGKWFGDIFNCPKPVVIACTGHAVAGGAVFTLVGDHRVGRAGAFKLGFNEVHIGVPMPEFGIGLVQYRIAAQHTEPILLGKMLNPTQAVEVGFLDETVDGEAADVIARAVECATELASRPAEAYAITKALARRALVERYLAEPADSLVPPG